MGRHFSFDGLGGYRLLLAVVSVLLLASLAVPAGAQRVVTEPPRTGGPPGMPPVGGGGGTGGGAGLLAPMPGLNSTLPSVTPAPVPTPPAAVAPAAPARVVRFRCELAPQDEACREPGSADGGGDDEECTCARDRCYTTEAGNRVCEKLQ
jgi:hypothetical protein